MKLTQRQLRCLIQEVLNTIPGQAPHFKVGDQVTTDPDDGTGTWVVDEVDVQINHVTRDDEYFYKIHLSDAPQAITYSRESELNKVPAKVKKAPALTPSFLKKQRQKQAKDWSRANFTGKKK